MQAPGAEYLVILNDGQLREGELRRLPWAPRSQPPPMSRLQGVTPWIGRLLMAMRGSLMRSRRLTRSVPAWHASPW
jgi:hypothetical protein